MMTSSQIRQSFLDFFKSKQHTIVPSSSLMPDAPNLLFTNAGMNQFVPIFLGQKKPDVSKWAGAVPGKDTRVADTQKCIRAGGKHNDLEDVGLDTYHHTLFEMLGNWSFGDYFKKEAIEWAWELVVGNWKFPPTRLYATVYRPGPGDPSVFDQEAHDHWERLFKAAGLDPKVHVRTGGEKDNFWMMGDTGPCGPCSEIHMDLTPAGDTKGSLVNVGDARCIEIWNLVFIQFNANADGTFSPLPSKHVDTGMGFERVTSIIQGTKNFRDFAHAKISNYETDIFRPIFDALEKLSGKKYGSTLPKVGQASSLSQTSKEKDEDRQDACPTPEQIQIDIAFRVIADHIRTLGFAIADGIQPSNEGRGYVLRRILRRAVRYGRTLGFHEPFFYKLVDVVADTMGDVFPEIRAKKKHVQTVIRGEEEAFNKTLDTGIRIFEQLVGVEMFLDRAVPSGLTFLTRVKQGTVQQVTVPAQLQQMAFELHERINQADNGIWEKTTSAAKKSLAKWASTLVAENIKWNEGRTGGFCPDNVPPSTTENAMDLAAQLGDLLIAVSAERRLISGAAAFLLYDEKGFPVDLTELMARECGLTVDRDGFEKLMEEQKARARAAQKREVIELSQIETTTPTKFVGYDQLETEAKVIELVGVKDKTAVVLDTSPLYAEMGGQVGDTGELLVAADVRRRTSTPNGSASSPRRLRITNTQKSGNTWLHFVASGEPLITEIIRANTAGESVIVRVDSLRRHAIQRHHTVTHLLHWALHEVVSRDAAQKGSFVGPDKLTFDFNAQPLTSQQVADVEKLVNERIVENAGVSWTEVPYDNVKSRKDVMQFFGEKYGDVVRVVQIGGQAQKLDGYSMELCGGTHTRATGEIGLFRIVAESAIAAGVRRIEAIAGLEAYRKAADEVALIKALAGRVNSPVHELERKIEALVDQQKALEKTLKAAQQREASNVASNLLEQIHTINGVPAIIHNLGAVDVDFLQMVADSLKGRFNGVIVLGGGPGRGSVSLVAAVSPEFTAKVQAGKIMQAIAPIVGGKGGGRPDNARGGGKDASKLDEALARAKSLLG